jgi:hypothetical protein
MGKGQFMRKYPPFNISVGNYSSVLKKKKAEVR